MTNGLGASRSVLLASVAVAAALFGAVGWVSLQDGMPARPISGSALHLAVMVDITLLALALGALAGFGAAWLLRAGPQQPDDPAQRMRGAIFDAATDLIVQTDRAGRLTYLNPAASRRLGMAPGAPLQDKLSVDFFPIHQIERLPRDVVPFELAHDVWTGESVACDADGREFTVWHMVIAHRGPQARLEGYSAILRDTSSCAAR